MDSDDKTIVREGGDGPKRRLQDGEEFGQYRVVRLLGRGGMGEVYEVEHTTLRTRHALKLINPEVLERPSARERFKREALVMAQLKHRNIVHVDDFGETGDCTWLRMELVEGCELDGRRVRNLGDLMNGQPLPPETVRVYLQDILVGLAAAHEQDTVHRDLKPANILLAGDGHCQITDFGLVRMAGEQWMQSQVQLTMVHAPTLVRDPDEDSAGTSTQALLGTFEYMSPEQKRGLEVDARSDLYAVGLMAYRMLTGEEMPGMRLPSVLVEGLDKAWDDWLIQALENDRTARFQSAEAMLAAMPGTQPAEQGNTKVVEPRRPAEREAEAAPKRNKKRKRWPMLALALLLLGAAGAGAAYYFQVLLPAHEEASGRAEEKRLQKEREAEAARLAEAARQAEALRIVNARGGIVVNTKPAGALVTIGSLAYEQKSPLTLKEVKLGDYPIEVKLAGYELWKGRVTVEEDRFADPGLVELVRKTGSVRVASMPDGAAVYDDGRKIGETPLTLDAIPEGTAVNFRLTKKGYKSADLQGVVAYNTQLSLRAVLEEITGPEPGEDWTLELSGSQSLAMKWIAPGSFTMGSPSSENGRDSDERQHRVTLSEGYWLGQTEVTQAQWEAEMGNNPSSFKGSNNPVEKVSWEDAMAFCRKVTERERAAGRLPEGYAYGLPTEAQWEYACRAGTTGAYAGDLDAMAWYNENSGRKSHPVARKRANAWGLYDMHGNVWEWCADWYGDYPSGSVRDPSGPNSGSNRVSRGGSWYRNAQYCRSANRSGFRPHFRLYYLGFRLCLQSIR